MLVTLDIKDETKKLLGDILKRYPYGETEGYSLGIACEDKSGALTCVLSLINAENGRLDFNTDIRFPMSMTLSQLKSKTKKCRRRHGYFNSGVYRNKRSLCLSRQLSCKDAS